MCWQLWIKVYCRGGCGMRVEEYTGGHVEDCGRSSGRDRYGHRVIYLCGRPEREYRMITGDNFCQDCEREKLDCRRNSSYHLSSGRMERSRTRDGRRYIVLPYRR